MALRSEAIWIIGGRIANAILLLVALRLMTTLLSPAQYGLVALLAAFQSFAGLILINPTGQYLNRHTHQWNDEGSLTAYIQAYARYWLLAAALTGVLCACWFSWSQPGDDLLVAGLTGMVLLAVIYSLTLQGTDVSRLNMIGYRRESVRWQLVTTFSSLVFSTSLCLIWPIAIAWIAGQAMGAWLGHIGALRVLRSVEKKSIFQKHYQTRELLLQSDFLRYSLPLALVTALMWLEGNGYRLILERSWSLPLIALFVLALSVPAQMTALVESIVMQLIYPYFFRAISGENSREHHGKAVGSMANVLLPLYLLWGAFLLLAAPHVLRLLTDARYHEAAEWVFVGVAAEIARLMVNVWQLVAQAEKNFAPFIFPFMVGAAGVLAGAGLTLLMDWDVLRFSVALLAALYLKMGVVVWAMHARLPVRVSMRRLMPAVLVLASAFGLNQLVTAEFEGVAALAYVSVAFGLIAVPILVHLKTSPDARYLFSFRLRGGS